MESDAVIMVVHRGHHKMATTAVGLLEASDDTKKEEI